MKRWLAAAIGAVVASGAWGCGDSGDGTPADDVVTGDTDVAEAPPVDGTPCDDGDPCTQDDQWTAGACKGTAYQCDGESPYCVTRVCDGAGGCKVGTVKDGICFVDGACYGAGAKPSTNVCRVCAPAGSQTEWTPDPTAGACSDGDPCTGGDHCADGLCVGAPVDCDDKNPCTSDHCDAGLGCVHDDAAGTCDDANPCTVGDTCEAGKCAAGKDSLDCDDKNPCTVDSCDPTTGCVHLADPAKACDDGNVCTEDTCTPATGCAHAPVAGACEDGNLCTTGDQCDAGKCVTGAGVADCEDNNPCTEDSCEPTFGCIHAHLAVTCDDGNACTENDLCVAGKCSGKKTIACGYCTYAANTDANKVTVLQMGNSGHPGEGLDLDANPATCAPETDCEGGIDNELGMLAGFVNSGLTQSVQGGGLIYVLEFVGFSKTATFTLNFLNAGLNEQTNPTCDYQKATCQYMPFQESMDVACKALVAFDNAKLDGLKLTAGGPKYTFALQASLVGGATMVIGIASARIEATVKLDVAGEHIASMDGIIGGAVSKAELMDTLSKLPSEIFPIDKASVLDLLDTAIVNDLDTDGNGTADSASVNIRFTTIPATLVPEVVL